MSRLNARFTLACAGARFRPLRRNSNFLDIGAKQGVRSRRPSVSRDRAHTGAGGGADDCVVDSPATHSCLNQSTNR